MSCDAYKRLEERPEVIKAIRDRVLKFIELGRKGKTHHNFQPYFDTEFDATIFSELAFCISAANSSAIAGLKFQKMLAEKENDNMDERRIRNALRKCGVRFYQRKAKYIIDAWQKMDEVLEVLKLEESAMVREWLVKNIKGIGYKEASHFLRNTGQLDVAIVDRHVLDWLYREGCIPFWWDPNLSKRKDYLKLEKLLCGIAHHKKMQVGELDLLIWWKMTGKVLK